MGETVRGRLLVSSIIVMLLMCMLIPTLSGLSLSSRKTRIRLVAKNWLNFDRVEEPVTVGVPIPMGALRSLDNVRLLDKSFREIPAQFKALAYWPDGSIMWVLTDFQCSVGAKGKTRYFIEYGGSVKRSIVNSPLKVFENDETIIISTGPVNMSISKESGMLENVWLDTDSDGEPDKLVLLKGFFTVLSEDGVEYYSNLGIREVEVEEAGVLRTVVKIKGTHRNMEGDGLLNFTARIYFYANKSYIRIFYTEENGLPCLNNGAGQPNCLCLNSPNTVYFEDISLELHLPTSISSYVIPLKNGLVEDDMPSNIYVYQDSSGGRDWNRWPGVKFRGYKVVENGLKKYRGRRFEGWMDFRTVDTGIAVGVRYFWENYPKAIEASSNGIIYVRIMPKYFSQPFQHRAGEHKTHELVLYFHSAMESAEQVSKTMKSLFTPIYVRPRAEWFIKSGVLDYWSPYDPQKLEFYEKNNLAAVIGRTEGYYGKNLFDIRERVDFYGWMHFGDVRIVDEDDGTGQMNLQYDFGFGMLAQSIRLAGHHNYRSYRWWILAEQAERHQADIDILHIHWGDPSQPSSYWIKWCWGGMFPHTPHEENGTLNPHRGSSPHLEFQWNRGLLYYYYLTGYEKAWEAAMEVGENTCWRVMNGPGEPGYSGVAGDEARAAANALDILINMYLATLNRTYLEAAEKVVNESHFNTRWYKDGPNPEYASHTVAPWQIAMLMVSLGRYLDTVRLAEGRLDQNALESLVGYADWMLKYCYHPHGDDASSYPHFIYRWRGDGVQIDWSPKGGANAWQVKIADAYTYAWLYTGNSTYLEIAKEQFEIGSKYFWYEDNPIGVFATGKNHAILATSGNIITGSVYQDSDPQPFVSEMPYENKEKRGSIPISVIVPVILAPIVLGALGSKKKILNIK